MFFIFAFKPIGFSTSWRYCDRLRCDGSRSLLLQTVTSAPVAPAALISYFAFARLYG